MRSAMRSAAAVHRQTGQRHARPCRPHGAALPSAALPCPLLLCSAWSVSGDTMLVLVAILGRTCRTMRSATTALRLTRLWHARPCWHGHRGAAGGSHTYIYTICAPLRPNRIKLNRSFCSAVRLLLDVGGLTRAIPCGTQHAQTGHCLIGVPS
jgi:hypothetical protein